MSDSNLDGFNNYEANPYLYYKGLKIKVLLVEDTHGYVKLEDVKKMEGVLPFLFNVVDKGHLTTIDGEEYLDNAVLSALLYCFHPEIQKEMVRQTEAQAILEIAIAVDESLDIPEVAKPYMRKMIVSWLTDLGMLEEIFPGTRIVKDDEEEDKDDRINGEWI